MNRERDALIHLWGAHLAALDWNERSTVKVNRTIHRYANRNGINFILFRDAVLIEAIRLYGIMVDKRARRRGLVTLDASAIEDVTVAGEGANWRDGDVHEDSCGEYLSDTKEV